MSWIPYKKHDVNTFMLISHDHLEMVERDRECERVKETGRQRKGEKEH